MKRAVFLTVLTALFVLGGCSATQHRWKLTDVRGHLPDLAFTLTDDAGKIVDASAFRGKLVLLYFGYTHCPDVCPLTLTHLHVLMQRLGPLADRTRVLFVSVDPARDTPAVLHAYVNAFDPHVTGLTGTPAQIEALAKRYRVAYNRGPALPGGGYEVAHSAGIYLFDSRGRARLLATDADPISAIEHDVRVLLGTSP